MGSNMSSSEIEQMAYKWKKAVLRFGFTDNLKKAYKIEGNPVGVVKFFRSFENNPQIKIISLAKAPQLKDAPQKITLTIKRVKYLPMIYRSHRNRRRYEKINRGDQ